MSSASTPPEFSQGVCRDGAAILMDGKPLTVEEILVKLRKGAEVGVAFRRGAKAMFDALAVRAANNRHGNEQINSACERENSVVMGWAEDALEEVSPESYVEWKGVTEAYRVGYETARAPKVQDDE